MEVGHTNLPRVLKVPGDMGRKKGISLRNTASCPRKEGAGMESR